MICKHLEAVLDGKITRLIITIPPRHMKSLNVAVFFPAFAWLQFPEKRFLYTTYADKLSIRDAVKSRRVITSPDYMELILESNPDFAMEGDQNTKSRYDNTQGGSRLTSSLKGSTTGEGGDIIVIDDPLSAKDASSEVKRQEVLDWWDQVMSTRLNDSKTGSYIIIMQRLHSRDLVGYILKREKEDWDHLCLPAEYEGMNRVRSSLGDVDPRKKIGDLLWEARFDRIAIDKMKRSLSIYGASGQLQQNPVPRQGAMFKVGEMKLEDDIPSEIIRSIRYWDKAGTEDGGKRTAGVLMHELKGGTFFIESVVTGQWAVENREANIKSTAIADGYSVKIWVEQEPGSGGKESAEATIKNLRGFSVEAEKPTGEKDVRAEPFAIQVAKGNVSLLRASWNNRYIDELRFFPKGEFADQVDASSGAFNKLFRNKRYGAW